MGQRVRAAQLTGIEGEGFLRSQLKVGTRQSELATLQTGLVIQELGKLFPDVELTAVGIHTLRDRVLDVALAKIGDQGLFTKELEQALLRGDIDLAVHSLKDMPVDLPAGLVLGAVVKREYAGDVLVTKSGLGLDDLPAGSRVGTASLRRRAQLLHHHPELRMELIRGNVPTRLARLAEGSVDALVLAYAGLFRLGLADRAASLIPLDVCLPAAGQGALGIEVRSEDHRVREMVGALDHPPSRLATEAERALLRAMEGGCQVPVGTFARVYGDRLTLSGMVASLDGSRLVRGETEGPAGDASALGVSLGRRLLDMGGADILREVRGETL